MKVLKLAAALFAAIAFAFALPLSVDAYTTADAASSGEDYSAAQYARATSREAYFCTSADVATGIFAVPYTYCVEVLYEEGDWYRVKYAEDYGIYRAVYGYVLKSQFELLSERPSTVYLYRSVSVNFSQDAPTGGLPEIDDITVTAAFYGSYYSGAAGYSYVLCNGSFGYISGANEDYPLIVPEGGDTPAADEHPADENSGGGTIVAVVIISVVIALAVGLVILSGRKSKRRKPEDPFGS